MWCVLRVVKYVMWCVWRVVEQREEWLRRREKVEKLFVDWSEDASHNGPVDWSTALQACASRTSSSASKAINAWAKKKGAME